MHFYFIPKTMPNGTEYETTFHMDFDIAEHFGTNSVKDAFKRAFKEWKNNIEYVTELGIVMNERCWFWYEQGNTELSQYYADRWYEVKHFVYENKKFTDSDRQHFFDLTD